MQNADVVTHQDPRSVQWNKGKLVGTKPPLRTKHVWSIRTKLQVNGRIRDLAMFNLAIDSKLRGCDVISLKVEDIAPHGLTIDRATKATLIYRRIGNLRAVQLLLGHTKIESTVRYLGIEMDDALAIAEQVDV
jgi:integrase